jgi:hypothetical protein
LRTGERQDTGPFLKINGRHAIVDDADIDTMRHVEHMLANPDIPGLP